MSTIAELNKVLNIGPISSAITATDVFTMENYGHVDLIINRLATPISNATVTLERSEDSTGAVGNSAINFNYWTCSSTVDLWSSRTNCASTGFSFTSGNNCAIVSLDSAELTTSSPWVCLKITGNDGEFYQVTAILSQGRYQGVSAPTALS